MDRPSGGKGSNRSVVVLTESIAMSSAAQERWERREEERRQGGTAVRQVACEIHSRSIPRQQAVTCLSTL
jgi:hypothetical protein